MDSGIKHARAGRFLCPFSAGPIFLCTVYYGRGVGIGTWLLNVGRSVVRSGIWMFSTLKEPAVSKVSTMMENPPLINHVLMLNDVPDWSDQNFSMA